MKFLSCVVLFGLIGIVSYAQTVYQIRADSVRIYSACDTAELIIENHTQDTLGVLFNKGKGRTEFRKMRLKLLGNSLAIVGQDTIQLGTLVKTAVDTLYRSADTLYYRKMDGRTFAIKMDLSAWGDSRYDLASTNFRVIADGDSVLFDNWAAGKVMGYFAYKGKDMPILSDQAFQGRGGKNYFNGLVVKTSPAGNATGFDFAINWDGELLGPNGAFIRTKDDNRLQWSAWRELLFKDYGDKSYLRNQYTVAQPFDSWITGIQRTEGRFSLLKLGSDALNASIVLEDPTSKGANIQLTGNDANGYPGLAFWAYDASGWKEAMRITPGGFIGMGVTNPRSKLDVTGAGIRASEYINTPFANSSNGGINQLWNSFEGRQLFPDPEFRSGMNNVISYNNAGGGAVTVVRTNAPLTNIVPNATGYYLKVDYKSGLPVTPGLGGIVAHINTAANKTYITRIRALIPVGYAIQQASNAHGTSWVDRWLSKTEGTGKWEDYIFRWGAGDGGSFSSVNYFYLAGPTTSDVTWYVSYFDAKDVTSSSWVDNIAVNTATARPIKLLLNTDSTELSQGVNNAFNVNVYSNGSVAKMNVGPSTLDYDGGQLRLLNTTANNIYFGTTATQVGKPALNTRSTGTKITLNPTISISQGDYSLGVDTSSLWLAVPQNNATNDFKFYGGTTEVGRIDGAGNSFWSGRGTFGTLATPVICSNNSIGDISIFGGATTVNSFKGAEIKLIAGANSTTPGAMSFHTGTGAGGTTQPERLRITASGSIGVGIATPASTFHVNGSVGGAARIVNSTTTANDADYTILVDASANTNITVFLPDATIREGRIYNIKLLGTGTSGGITIKPAAAGQKLDNATSFTSAVAYLGITVQAVAGNWYIIAKHQP